MSIRHGGLFKLFGTRVGLDQDGLEPSQRIPNTSFEVGFVTHHQGRASVIEHVLKALKWLVRAQWN